MELTEILNQQADYTRNSNYTVEASRIFSWVAIDCQDKGAEDHESVFLQGEEAEMFMDEADRLYDEVGTVDYETVAYATAAQYVESI